uniref:G-protein coupled receptors family 1 profile domain-containing protein n=1 Tax=Timema cristinae TaxID=61476 RepID=A0A7R9D8C2_TIMCR|nr:unnamed protein product [Timema cristinae]
MDDYSTLTPDEEWLQQINVQALSDPDYVINDTTHYNQSLDKANKSAESSAQDMLIKTIYLYSVPPLVIFCIVSIAVNIGILASVYWIRRPVSPTLYISLSLAGADAFTSTILGTNLVLHSLLPKVFNVNVTSFRSCLWISIEAMRLSGVICTVMHLLALAGNHYLGIRRPLHYASIMTHRNTTVCIVFLWTVPTAFFFIYFSAVPGEGYQSEYCDKHDFMVNLMFRMVFSSLFFGPFVVMLVIYTHIFAIVKRHQATRLRFSQMNHRTSCKGDSSGSQQQQQVRSKGDVNTLTGADHKGAQQRQFARTVKAVYTTLLILGSFVIGWLPAVITYILICDDCVFKFTDIDPVLNTLVNAIVNFLIICKTLFNPIVYAARMQEIKIALHQMKLNVCRRCFPFLTAARDGEAFGNSEASQYGLQHRLSQHNTSSTNMGRSNTTVYRMRSQLGDSNGNLKTSDALLHRASTRSHHRYREGSATTDL